MTNGLRFCATILLAGATSVYASSALAGADTFNRESLGSTWKSTSGKLSILNDQLQGKTLSTGYQKSSTGNNAVSATIFTGGTDLEYGALTLGSLPNGTNAFVKLQAQNGTGSFDHAAFYTGNNSGNDFFALSSAVSSPAVVDVTFCGTVATMRITAASGVQVYSFDYGTSYVGGGVGTYGMAKIDNFIAYNSPACSGSARAPAGAIAIHGATALDKTH